MARAVQHRTLPFYWGRFEPERGRSDTARLLAIARWFRERGVALKGHPLVWHTVQPQWLLDLPVREVERVQRERIRRDVADFDGLIDTWDAINEVVMSTAYECLIEGVLEAGVEIDVLGLQSHMHEGYWGEERTLEVLERFSRHGLPIHFTESTLLSGHLMPAEIEDLNDYRIPDWPSTPEGEEQQADEMVRHYRTLLSHPSVQNITYWGPSDDGMWLGAPGGLVRKDGTPKPAYDALHGLVKGEWWLPPTGARTDGAGRVRGGRVVRRVPRRRAGRRREVHAGARCG